MPSGQRYGSVRLQYYTGPLTGRVSSRPGVDGRRDKNQLRLRSQDDEPKITREHLQLSAANNTITMGWPRGYAVIHLIKDHAVRG